MEHMTPKRLEVMLSVRNNPSITGITFDPNMNDGIGITSFCVCMVPLVYEGSSWWYLNTGILAELPHEPRDIRLIYAEIKRVLSILAPHFSVDTVNSMRELGWLQTIG